MNRILREILSTKRPTKDVKQNIEFLLKLLSKWGIKDVAGDSSGNVWVLRG